MTRNRVQGDEKLHKQSRSPLDEALGAMRHADVLVAGPAAGSIASWLADNLNHNFDIYDRAIDSAYNATHIGGSQ